MANDKKIYMIGLGIILLFILTANSAPLQSSMATFDSDNIGGWFKSLSESVQNVILVVLGIILFLIVIGFLMRG